MKNFRVFLISIFLPTGFISAQQADLRTNPYPQVQEEIRQLVKNIFADGAAKKLEALDAYHLNSPKFTRVDNSGLLTYQQGKELEEAFYGVADILSFEVPLQKVDVYGDVAISSFHLNMKAVFNDETIERKAKASLTFVKTGEGWKIVHEHISPRK